MASKRGLKQPRYNSAAVVRLALLCTILGSAWTARTIFNPLLDLAKADLALSDLQIGLAQGAALSLPSVLLSIPLGRMVDTRNRTRLLFSVAALTMLGSMATAFSDSFTDLVAYRALTGLGMLEEAIVFSLAADLFPPEQRGKVNAVIVLGEYGGTALGFALAGWLLPTAIFLPWLSEMGGWRIVPFLFGVLGLFIALPLLWLKEPPRHERAPENAGGGVWQSFRSLSGFGSLLWPLLLSQATAIAAINMASMWAVTVFIRNFALTGAQGGKLIAAAMFGPPLLGAIVAGALADRLGGYRGAIAVAAGASILALPGAAFPIASSMSVSTVLLGILMMGQTASLLASSTVGVLAIPNGLRGLWFGISATITILVGFAVAPTLVAWLASNMKGSNPLPLALAISLAVSGLVASGGFIFAARQSSRQPWAQP